MFKERQPDETKHVNRSRHPGQMSNNETNKSLTQPMAARNVSQIPGSIELSEIYVSCSYPSGPYHRCLGIITHKGQGPSGITVESEMDMEAKQYCISKGKKEEHTGRGDAPVVLQEGPRVPRKPSNPRPEPWKRRATSGRSVILYRQTTGRELVS